MLGPVIFVSFTGYMACFGLLLVLCESRYGSVPFDAVGPLAAAAVSLFLGVIAAVMLTLGIAVSISSDA